MGEIWEAGGRKCAGRDGADLSLRYMKKLGTRLIISLPNLSSADKPDPGSITTAQLPVNCCPGYLHSMEAGEAQQCHAVPIAGLVLHTLTQRTIYIAKYHLPYCEVTGKH